MCNVLSINNIPSLRNQDEINVMNRRSFAWHFRLHSQLFFLFLSAKDAVTLSKFDCLFSFLGHYGSSYGLLVGTGLSVGMTGV